MGFLANINSKLIGKIMEMLALKFIGVGLCSIGMAGAAIAIGKYLRIFLQQHCKKSFSCSKA